jgi:hypothetical protein
VGFFEHSGSLSGASALTLPFSADAVNDALKSLTVNDPASDFPIVRYAAASALNRSLQSLAIDLSGGPGIAGILNSLKGAELEISAPAQISGRIIGVEERSKSAGFQDPGTGEFWLSLFTSQGIRSVNIKDIASFAFKDERINADLNRALDLIMASRDTESRNLFLTLPGEGSRDVSLSYVIPMPVWKAAYRLDLSAKEPFIQGWAIVDNDSNTDWNNIELSLVTGRPVSFIQNLYAPYRTSRPVLPLAIAGIAESRTYDSGSEYVERPYAGDSSAKTLSRSRVMADESVENAVPEYAPAPRAASSVAGGSIQTALGSAAGDQFEFTLRRPVSLERRQSAMLPLVEAPLQVEKTLVFSGSLVSPGVSVHPAISAMLTNTTGMKLPAGPVTVYDSGTYAGDALLEFFPESEKRLISYGEDLSVTGSVRASNSRQVTAVSVSGGIMTITRRQLYEKVYAIRNAGKEAKKIIIEHPITPGAALSEPAAYDEKTLSLYRFSRSLPASQESAFTVLEETPVSERITLAQLRPETFLSYASNQEIPANVRSALGRAMEFKRKADDAAASKQDLENRRNGIVSEQERIRANLLAAGSTPQGQEYLRRMAAMDGEIDALNARISDADKAAQAAKKEYDTYVASIQL